MVIEAPFLNYSSVISTNVAESNIGSDGICLAVERGVLIGEVLNAFPQRVVIVDVVINGSKESLKSQTGIYARA